MGIKEIIAAKKAAALAATGSTPMTAESGNVPAVQTVVVQDPSEKAPIIGVNTEEKAIEQVTIGTPAEQGKPAFVFNSKEEYEKQKPAYPTHDAAGRPLSGFAIIQAKKKIDAAWAARPQAEPETVPHTESTMEVATPAGSFAKQSAAQDLKDLEAKIDLTKAVPGPEVAITPHLTVPSLHAEGEEEDEGTPEAQQAYADIKVKLDSLVALSEDNLKTAMQELKKALMQNPNAIALMLPSDVGQMVIALRKMTGVELAAAEKIKSGKVTKKSKEPILTAEQMEEAWKEL